MPSLFRRFAGLLTLIGLWVGSASQSMAEVNLEWRPAVQTVDQWENVEIGLYAVSDNGTNQSMSVVEAILLWDPPRMGLIGYENNGSYTWLASGFPDDSVWDGLNYPFTGGTPFVPADDGDAWYNALSQFPPNPPAMATPAGLRVVTFRFRAYQAGTTELELPAEFGESTHTRVIDAVIPGLDVTGTLGPPAVVHILPSDIPAVSTWGLVVMALMALCAGAIVFRGIRPRGGCPPVPLRSAARTPG